MTANLSIYTLELENATAVPLKALKFNPMSEDEGSDLPKAQPLKEPAKNSVWVLRDNALIETSVELGMKNSVYQQITSGLKQGDKVALQYVEKQLGNKGPKAQENPFMPKPPGSKKK